MVTGGSYTKCRLDRVLGDTAWLAKYPLASVAHLTGVSSDHAPLLLEMDGGTAEHVQRPFKYEVMWESHDIVRKVISMGWGASTPCTTVEEIRHKLKGLAKDLGR